MAAVIYQSSQTNSGTSITSLTITKPTGLAVGDFMLAPITYAYGGNSTALVTPTGWTATVVPSNATNGGSALYSKIADANDVAATNFTFALNGITADAITGAVSRFTVNRTTNPIDQITTASSSTGTAITPTVAMGLFIMVAYGENTSAATGSYAGYAIVNNNPTWTEAYDFGATFATNKLGLAMAYANSTRLASSGAPSVTPTGYNNNALAFLDVVPDVLMPIAVSDTLPSPSLRYTVSPWSISTLMNVPTAGNTPQKYANVQKHTSSWVNQNKS